MTYIVAVTPPTGGSGVVPAGTSLSVPAVSGWIPQIGDRLYVFCNCNGASAALTGVSGWVTDQVTHSAANTAFQVHHDVTLAEVVAGTTTWTVAGFFTASASGRGVAIVVRGHRYHSVAGSVGTVSPTSPPDFVSAEDGALVLGYVAPADTGRGIDLPPAGFTSLARGQANVGVTSQMLYRRDTLAAAAEAVDLGDVTLGSDDDWVGLSAAVYPVRPSSGFFACM